MFTKQEIQIILLIAEGYRPAELADKLFISRQTLKTHRRNIIRKIKSSTDTDISILQFAIGYARNSDKYP
jgi:DNA-binding CsgD family transcriptional regulator